MKLPLTGKPARSTARLAWASGLDRGVWQLARLGGNTVTATALSTRDRVPALQSPGNRELVTWSDCSDRVVRATAKTDCYATVEEWV